ncbi:MAG: LysM peptidoglycan-binding domain-containing protein [Anaerolineaceae bacterium]|nr:LysM peptidoglycan-binding domain-containing protein [Anaerolineaceae bacterium]
MKKIVYPMILIILMLSLVLGGCTRSATKGGGGDVAVDTPDIPFPVGPENNPNRITEIIAVTQTAEAQVSGDAGQPAQEVATATPEAVLEETPKSLPSSTAVVVPTATPGLPTTYTVQDGEFPYCLARRFNINPNDLVSINNISGFVAPGTVLTIPTDSTWPVEFERALIAHPTTYNVLAGDTIYKIACQFGDVDPNDIIFANNLEDPYTLTASQVINIP